MANLGDIRALLIEPHNGMRTTLHNMLNLCGITKIEHAISAGTAMRCIQNTIFDLILCEYELGEGQDGQQLLEDIRHHKLAPLTTIFIMVTAERAYTKVVSAAELAPSDYLLKPFTADTLLERVKKAVEKRKAFIAVYNLMDQGSLADAVEACILGLELYPKYAVDFMRFRAELHVTLGEPKEAEEIYKTLYDMKAIAWARLGLAKTLYMQGQYQEAEQILTNLIEHNTNYMDAYDWLAKTHEAIGEIQQAKDILDTAVGVSPHSLRRLRKFGALAHETGDIKTAEAVLKKVVLKAKFSEFRDPEDYVNLVKIQIEKGEHDKAKTTIRELEKSMVGLKKTEACRAISSAMLHAATGDARLLTELTAAINANREDIGLSNNIKLNLAKNCLANNQDDAASEVILEVMRSTSNQSVITKALDVFSSSGKGFLGTKLLEQTQQEVKDLIALGVSKAKSGDFKGSVELMSNAANKSPDNPQVILNAALAALKCIENLGWDQGNASLAKNFIEAASRLDPMNPRLKAIRSLHDALKSRFGIASSR